MASISELKRELTALKERFKQDGQNEFKKEFAAIFEKYPQVDALRWAQYTPYFNDGDACIFGVGELTIRLVGADLSSSGYRDGFNEAASYNKESLNKALAEWWRSIQLNELFEAVFGDHVQVTVTRDVIDISEYDHE
jgi:hypothetical protein